MDHVPSMAAVTAATQKAQPAEAASLTVTKEVSPSGSAGLDPRSVYKLSPETAGAVLSLSQAKAQAVAVAEFEARFGHGPQAGGAVMATAVATTPVISPETTKTAAAANRNWSEDVRLEHIPVRKVGMDTLVAYDNPRVMAAWRAAFPDVVGRKFRGLQLSDADVRTALGKTGADSNFDGLAKDIYLLCNDEHFRIFSEHHPSIHINWINVDNEEILMFWPKDRDQD